jgi:hypothetical protein
VALIEVPPYDSSAEASRSGQVLRGRLADSSRYFVETPVVAVVSEGRVESVLPGTSISAVKDVLIPRR